MLNVMDCLSDWSTPSLYLAKVLAKPICGLESKGYTGTILSTQLKIVGVDVFSVGRFTRDEGL